MAIVFISAKQKQQSFIWGVAILLMLVLVGILLAIFLPGFLNPKEYAPIALSNPGAAALAINFSVMDSDRVKNLEPFSFPENMFTYTVTDQKGKKITGNIPAKTKEEAQALLESSGFNVVSITDMAVGRSEPFISY